MTLPKMEYKDNLLKIYLNNLSGEGDIGVPEVHLKITSIPIVAGHRKLKWIWVRKQYKN
jgi:hypothetical protein